MSALAWVLLAITGLFGLLLVIKQLRGKARFCAICLAVSLTWLGLLIFHYVGFFEDKVLIAILMGQSSLGIYYLLEKRAPRDMLVFRLPLLATLILVVYWVISQIILIDAVALVLALWTITGSLYLFRTRAAIRNKVKSLIECCGDW